VRRPSIPVKLSASFLAAGLFLLSATLVPAATFDVEIAPNDTMTFSPANLTIGVGDTVHWVVDTTSFIHTTTSNITHQPDSWDSGNLSTGDTFDHTFNTPGTFAYHCQYHAKMGMVGNITVGLAVVAPTLDSLVLGNTTVLAGLSTTATATLTAIALTGGANVTFSSDTKNVTIVPAHILIRAGNTSATVTVKTVGSLAASTANITASYKGATQTALLHLNAAGSLLPTLIINPNTLLGGASVVGYANLTAPAFINTVIRLKSDTTSAAIVPSSVTIIKGKTFGAFLIKSKLVAAEVKPIITATSGNLTATGMVIVQPVLIESLVINPSTIVGGKLANGTITLNVPAPIPIAIPFFSGNSSAARVPRDVDVLLGKRTATFKVDASGRIKSEETLQITAKLTGLTTNATITVDPPPPPPKK
jgi:plastocyanin